MIKLWVWGYSYPLADLQAIIGAEARQGRTVTVAIQHAGGWTVSGEPIPPDATIDELTEFLQEHAARRYQVSEE